jgi:hypothetical protein
MKHVLAFSLPVLCMAFSQGCAQLPQERMPQARAPAAESAPASARLDARWSSAIVGMAVESAAGEKLGRVQDVIVDGYGHPAFAILSYRGALEPVTKYAAVPWATVAEMLDRDKLVVNQPVLEKRGRSRSSRAIPTSPRLARKSWSPTRCATRASPGSSRA